MEKTARRQQIIKWQLILGAVVCAIVAFCCMPGSIIAADAATETVEYIDRVWNEEIKKVETITTDENGNNLTHECDVLDEDQCDKGLDSGWYVLNSSFTYKKHVNINKNQDVKIILKDGCTLTATKKGFSVKDGAVLTVYGQSNGTGKLDLDGNSGDAGLRVPQSATLNIKGGTIRAEGTSGGAGIGGDKKESAGNINIYGGKVTAEGGNKAAGIGGGYGKRTGGTGGTTTIYGGRVTAMGSKGGAGIGGGYGAGGGSVCSGGNGGDTKINGGTVTVEGSKGASAIGGGAGTDDIRKGEDGTIDITGGNIKGYYTHTITLDEVTEEVEVVGVNIDYRVNDVYTLDKGKLYFYMSNEEYAKLTEITVRYKDGKEDTYYKTSDPYVFSKKQPVNITGVEAQDGVYNCLPQQGYKGTPVNEQGYDGEYEITYYLSNGEKTKPENSGAEGEGNAPVYAGEYKVRIAIPISNRDYAGFYELEFKVEKAVPEIVEQPTLSGVYGTAVRDMHISGGVVKDGDEQLEGRWEITDLRILCIPEVGTINSYEVKFTPESNNYATLTVMVVPNVEKATATIVEEPTLSGVYGTAVKDMEILGGVAKVGDEQLEGKWTVTDAKSTDIPDVGTENSYEVTFDSQKYRAATMVVPEIEKANATVVEAPTLSGVYGTAVKDMEISGGVVKSENGTTIEGTWTVTDAKASDIPEIGTTEAYEVTFDSQKYRAATMVVPEVEKATPEIVEAPMLTIFYKHGEYSSSACPEYYGGLVKAGDLEIEGSWKLNGIYNLFFPPRDDIYEIIFIPTNTCNCNSVTTTVIANYDVVTSISATQAVDANSENNNQKLIDKLQEKLSNPEVKARLSEPEVRNNIREKILKSELIKDTENKIKLKELLSTKPELKNKVKDKITNTELIEDDEVRESLLSFIEE